MIPEFIRIEHTFEAAMSYRNSGQEDPAAYRFDGVQLLPNNPLPYIQRTHTSEGIELEDWQVWAMSLCGEELQDITDYFNVTRVFQDKNGLPQIEWELRNVPFDFSDSFIYLKILQGFNDYMYTNPFKLTSYNSDLTDRVDYRNATDTTMLSIQLRLYFREEMDAINLVSSDDVSRGIRVTQNATVTPYEFWKTQLIERGILRKITNLFVCKYVYIGLQRATLFDVYETPKIEFDENFVETDIMLTRDASDTYDPLYIAPVPPTPPVVDKEIVLEKILSLNNTQVQFIFHYENFAPTYASVEFSSSPTGPWTASNGSPVSPRVLTVPNHLTSNYYYRVFHAGDNIASNVLQLPPATINIENVTGYPGTFIQTGNRYEIEYFITGFTPTSQLSFEGSTDDVLWQPMYYNAGNENPKAFSAPSSGLEFKYFRIKYNALGLVSNSYFHEF